MDNVINFFTDSSANYLDENYNPYGSTSAAETSAPEKDLPKAMSKDISRTNIDP